jgi:hypothetical protein
MSETLTVEILNWDKYNPRKDVKKPAWFACSNSLFDNHEFYDFTHTEMISWIYMLSLASKKLSGVITIHWEHLERIGRIKKKDFLAAIEKLQRNHCVRVSSLPTYGSRTESVQNPYATQQDKTLHNKTGQDTTCDAPAYAPDAESEFVKIWNSIGLGQVEKVTTKRRTHMRQRLKENPDLDYWAGVAQKISASDFCRGLVGNSKWVASFDWFITPDAHIKVMEGKYDNQDRPAGQMSLVERIKLAQKGIPA